MGLNDVLLPGECCHSGDTYPTACADAAEGGGCVVYETPLDAAPPSDARDAADLAAPEPSSLAEALDALATRTSFHVPGHKGALDPRDATELPFTDDALRPTGVIKALEERLSRLLRAPHTCLSTCGSTAGVLAMIMSAVKPGETLLLPRASHVSAYHACVLGGIVPRYIAPDYDEQSDYCYTSESALLSALDAYPDAKALLITRPDYYGEMVPLERVAAKARALGINLLVDEAHGAHLALMGLSCAADYADVWVQSAHKTLPALTPAAMVHARTREDMEGLRRTLRLVHTSSPSYPVLLSMEGMAARLEGLDVRESLMRMEGLRGAVTASGVYADHAETLKRLGLCADPTRLVLTWAGGGFALRDALAECGVDIEMADARRAVCVLTLTDDPMTYRILQEKLSSISAKNAHPNAPIYRPSIGDACVSPREAALSGTVRVPLTRAVGRVAAVCAGLYPPGVPLIAPGDRVTQGAVDALMRAMECGADAFGIEDGYIVITQGVE